MDVDTKIESVRKDLRKGLKTRAINRLQGLINAYPNCLEFREELGRVYGSVGWKEKSRLYYLLTECKSKEALEYTKAFMQSLNNSGYAILQSLKFKGDKSSLPASVRKTLESLEERSLEETGTIPTFVKVAAQRVNSKKIELESIMALVGLILILYLIIAGLIQSVKWIL